MDKSRHDIDARCAKSGFGDGRLLTPSSFQPWTLGNIMLGGPIGIVIDLISRAYVKYPLNSKIRLAPLPTPPELPLTRAPATSAPVESEPLTQ